MLQVGIVVGSLGLPWRQLAFFDFCTAKERDVATLGLGW
jgi:hypothetical protein